MAIYKNTASQKIAVFAYTAATGAAKTGDAANITAYISKDWGAPAAITDTNPAELDATNMPGWFVFDLTQAETDAEVLVIAPKSSTSGVVLDQVQVVTQDAAISSRAIAGDAMTLTAAYDAAKTAASQTSVNTIDDFLDTEIAAILADTNELQTDWANGGRLDNILDARASQTSVDGIPTNAEFEARTLPAADYFDPAADAVANVTTVGSVTGAVGSVTGNVDGNVTGSVGSVATGGITAASIATNAIDADAIATDAVTELQSGLATAASISGLNNLSAAQVNAEVDTALADYDPPTKAELDSAVAPLALEATVGALNDITAADVVTAIEAATVDGTITRLQMERIMLAFIGGLTTGGGTQNLAFLAQDDSTPRITATMDEDGNRDAVTLDGA